MCKSLEELVTFINKERCLHGNLWTVINHRTLPQQSSFELSGLLHFLEKLKTQLRTRSSWVWLTLKAFFIHKHWDNLVSFPPILPNYLIRSKNYHFWLRICCRYENLRTNYIVDKNLFFSGKVWTSKAEIMQNFQPRRYRAEADAPSILSKSR